MFVKKETMSPPNSARGIGDEGVIFSVNSPLEPVIQDPFHFPRSFHFKDIQQQEQNHYHHHLREVILIFLLQGPFLSREDHGIPGSQQGSGQCKWHHHFQFKKIQYHHHQVREENSISHSPQLLYLRADFLEDFTMMIPGKISIREGKRHRKFSTSEF